MLKNDWLQEKLNGVLVELRTADIFSDATTVYSEEIVQKMPEKHPEAKKKGGINLSIINEEDD